MHRVWTALLILSSSCEIQKEKYQNPRTRANLEAQATSSPGPISLIDWSTAQSAVGLALPRQIASAASPAVSITASPHYSKDACQISNRLVDVAKLVGELSQYLCVLNKVGVKSENQEITVQSGNRILSFRLAVSDSGMDVTVCKDGIPVASFDRLVSSNSEATLEFSAQGFALSDGRVGALDGRASLIGADRRFAVRMITTKAEKRVGSLRYAQFFDGRGLEFLSFGGSDSALTPAQVNAAGRFDSSAKRGSLFAHFPELQLGGFSYLDDQGLAIEDGPTQFADLAKGGRLSPRWSDVSQQLPNNFKPLEVSDWSCEAKKSIEMEADSMKACEVQSHGVLDCEQEVFRPSIPSGDVDYPSMTDRFDRLKFDIF